ncbi:hypothetical protein SAICODRAFT_32295 [Saitoella complicata NRRL Y-17804]|uniref:uncharacterized protein n=1 Tax=Saitoella complicata (strain BCRC 22490 / CBS 7301 / JCM 7358 / NBRC 10748 / NRRL Y-17804) TaxID=698492 RepID=UPI0008670411|nr:uncharacterized protein SAICODRAFT_32295 [Saitoella complicata NRRL Y-17804]ODQ49806.1 hypothetical protein SAICODRAFT_32295 [Saitoella complicata NRRL Y-17804]
MLLSEVSRLETSRTTRRTFLRPKDQRAAPSQSRLSTKCSGRPQKKTPPSRITDKGAVLLTRSVDSPETMMDTSVTLIAYSMTVIIDASEVYFPNACIAVV